jgi:RNA polymerase sigma factor (sigma-70 family)
LKEIYKQHQRWINTVKQFGIDDYAEDIVQEAYIKCFDKLAINEAYFFMTLRSLSFDLLRKQKRIKKVSIDEVEIKTEIEQQNEVLNLVDDFHWFDKQIFYLYYDNKMSMRKIAEETGISLKTIFNTITKCNNKIKNEWLKEDQKNQ